jgi:hypothetical protein
MDVREAVVLSSWNQAGWLLPLSEKPDVAFGESSSA